MAQCLLFLSLKEHLAKLEHDTEGRKGKNFKGSFASRRRVDPGIVVQNNGERSCSSIIFFYLTQNDSTLIIESLASLYYLQFAPRRGLYLGREVEEACR